MVGSRARSTKVSVEARDEGPEEGFITDRLLGHFFGKEVKKSRKYNAL